MRRRSIFTLALLVAALAPPAGATDPTRTIVRIQAGLVGRVVIQSICAQLHCQVVGSLDGLPGETEPSSLFLVNNLPPPGGLVNYTLLGIEAVEADLPPDSRPTMMTSTGTRRRPRPPSSTSCGTARPSPRPTRVR